MVEYVRPQRVQKTTEAERRNEHQNHELDHHSSEGEHHEIIFERHEGQPAGLRVRHML